MNAWIFAVATLSVVVAGDVHAQEYVSVGREGRAAAALEVAPNANSAGSGYFLILSPTQGRRTEYAVVAVTYDCAAGVRTERGRTIYRSTRDPVRQNDTNIQTRLEDRPDLAPQFAVACSQPNAARRTAYPNIEAFVATTR